MMNEIALSTDPEASHLRQAAALNVGRAYFYGFGVSRSEELAEKLGLSRPLKLIFGSCVNYYFFCLYLVWLLLECLLYHACLDWTCLYQHCHSHHRPSWWWLFFDHLSKHPPGFGSSQPKGSRRRSHALRLRRSSDFSTPSPTIATSTSRFTFIPSPGKRDPSSLRVGQNEMK